MRNHWAMIFYYIIIRLILNQCMKRPVAHSLNSTWFWIELPENCCEPLKFIMKYISIQFCERPGHGWPFHALLNIFFKKIYISQKTTKFGSQNFGYQIWFCTRLLKHSHMKSSWLKFVENNFVNIFISVKEFGWHPQIEYRVINF